jgi:hypothetical protein
MSLVKRMGLPVAISAVWFLVPHVMPWEIALPVMMVCAVLLGASFWYATGRDR